MEAQGRKGKGECFKQVKQDLGDWSYLRKEGKSVLQGKGLRESFIMVSKTLLEDVTTNWQIMSIIRMANCPFPFFIRQRTKGLNLWVPSWGELVTFSWQGMLASVRASTSSEQKWHGAPQREWYLRAISLPEPSSHITSSLLKTSSICRATSDPHPRCPSSLRILSIGHMPRGIITLWFSPLLDPRQHLHHFFF